MQCILVGKNRTNCGHIIEASGTDWRARKGGKIVAVSFPTGSHSGAWAFGHLHYSPAHRGSVGNLSTCLDNLPSAAMSPGLTLETMNKRTT